MNDKFTIKQVSEFFGINDKTLYDRAERLALPRNFHERIAHKGKRVRCFTWAEVKQIIKNPFDADRNTVFMLRTEKFLVYESKLNYTPYNQL